jgi:hypothetical protein
MPDTRIKDFSVQAEFPAGDDFLPFDGATNGTRKWKGSAIASLTNPRATQRELVWDGTTNARLQATLTGQNIATGDVVLVWKGRFNTEAADQWLIATGPATGELVGGAGGFGIFKTGAGHLQAGWQGSGGYEFRRVANAVATYGDAEILVIAARSGSTLKIWINSVEIAHTAGDTTASLLSSSVTSTFLAVNFRGSNYSTGYKGSFSRGWIGNFMPSQADVNEIMRNGGRPPLRYQWGSEVLLNSGAFANEANPARDYDSFSGASATGFTAVKSGTSQEANIYSSADFPALGGRTFILTCDVVLNSGTLPFVYVSNIAGSPLSNAAVRLTGGSHSQIITVTTNPGALAQRLRFYNAAAEVVDYSVSNLKFKQIGAFCYLDAENGGVGLQVPDPANKLHGLLISGGTWNGPITPTGFVRATSDGTTTAQQLGGGTILPANIQILRVRARALTGTPSITLGTSSGGSQIVASVALSTTWKNLTIALTDGIATTASSLWMTASAANVVEVQVAYEQLPA